MLSTFLTLTIIGISIYGYIVYGIETRRRTLRPRAATWLIWAVIGTCVSALQLEHGAGIGAAVTIIAAIANYILAGMAWYYGHRTVHPIDVVSSLAALGVFVLWATVGDVVTVAVATVAYLFGFMPTFERAYRKPYSENLAPFVANILKYALSLLTIEQLNIETTLYPVILTVFNAMFLVMILVKRRKNPQKPLAKNKRKRYNN